MLIRLFEENNRFELKIGTIVIKGCAHDKNFFGETELVIDFRLNVECWPKSSGIIGLKGMVYDLSFSS